MGKIVVGENVTLDGVIQDPAGAEGFRHGGWVGRVGDMGPAHLRVPRRAVAIPQRRAGGQDERHAQVRRVLDPQGSPAGTTRGC